MSRRTWGWAMPGGLVLVACFSAAAEPRVARPAGLEVWTQSVLQRVRPTDRGEAGKPPAPNAIVVFMCSLQFVGDPRVMSR